MINQEAFELWYKVNYWDWDFSGSTVSFDKEKNRYTNFSVNLAWNAWNAALRCYKVNA